jgi:hypothetical protein
MPLNLFGGKSHMKFVNDDKRAQIQLEKALKAGNKPMYVAVGILQDEKRDDGFSMVDLAMVHEYGSKDGHIPERSFIRSSCDAKRKEHLRLLRRLEKQVILGHLNKKQALTQFGEMVKSDMVQAINNGLEPDIAESTKKQKIRSLKRQKKKLSGIGFKPLIESGQLKGSITHEVRGGAL